MGKTVIFLDIDGVLNSECFFVMRARNMRGLRLMDVDDSIDKSVQNRMYCIDPRNLDVLMELIEETKSKSLFIRRISRLGNH